MTSNNWLNTIKFNENGLIPAIAQDHKTNTVLMVAWMNADALKLTVQTRTAVYFSRSRNKLWHKGETSGHTQKVHDIFIDCDSDVILLSVSQIGGIACHTGRQSCFYRRLDLSQSVPDWEVISPVLKDPAQIYGETKQVSTDRPLLPQEVSSDLLSDLPEHDLPVNGASVSDSSIDAQSLLKELDKVLLERKSAAADSSYVASLYAKGINKILEKVGEESVEMIIAAKDLATSSKNHQPLTNDLIYEIADVWFHTLVTLAWFDIPSESILTELSRRFGLSGIDEKAARLS